MVPLAALSPEHRRALEDCKERRDTPAPSSSEEDEEPSSGLEPLKELPEAVTTCVNYLCEMRRIDSSFSCGGRTPKSVAASLSAYEHTTLTFTDDEAFLPNPVQQ